MERSCSVRRPRRRLLRREVPVRFVAFAVLSCVLAVPAPAQDGGVVGRFCTDDPWCVDDTLEIVFESGTSTYEGPLGVGVEVPIEVVLDVKSPDIQGYSWGVKHDEEFLSLIAERVTVAGTVVDPERRDTTLGDSYFVVARAVEGGVISAVVLSFFDMATLPLGRNAICRAAYRVATTPECTVIRFADRQLSVPGSPPVSLILTVRGGTTQPRFFRHGLIRTGDCPETCDDLADNDGDGRVDCDDSGCAADIACAGREVCDDGIDNDSDGQVDCQDFHCRGVHDCPDRERCADGLDNDGDDLADCDDPDCAMLRTCQGLEVCDDGIDNDEDGPIDCDDSDCWGLASCRSPEVCDDGADNDRDGSTDCRDPDCRGGVACLETCDDGIDNDLDSLTDCHDRDCSGVGGCPEFEVCDDGRDNDEDGLTDCDDPECRWQNPCVEVCDDGIDNDDDGFVDGLDQDCNGYGPERSDAAPPLAGAFPPVELIRGDADGSGRLTVLDAVILIQVAVNGEAPPFDCFEALNTNDDGGVNVADALPILRWIFLDGPPLPAPFPECDLIFGGCTEASPGCR